tara:strand:- start:806 stop:1309 length:504 start_codon:yes stop_codon:yes gene_type:complete
MTNLHNGIFLDRDGVINEKRDDYVKFVSELNIFSYVSKSIKKLHDLGFLVVVITNQSAINRGLITHDQLKKIHDAIQENLKSSKTKIDAFYYCPHTPTELCSCRKPKPELILQASNDLNIKLDSSWFFGDSESDIIAGKSAGCKTVKITNKLNLLDAVEELEKTITK